MKKNKPQSVQEILSELKKKSEIGLQLEYAQIWDEWESLVGVHLARHSHPMTVKEGVLYVHAERSPWMHKLAYEKWNILKRINKLANKELVSDLYIQLEPDSDPTTPQYGA